LILVALVDLDPAACGAILSVMTAAQETFYRTVYVLLGTFLGALIGYWFAKYSVLFVFIQFHLWDPEQYSFQQMMTDGRNVRSWLCPVVAVAAGGYAALTCYRFARPPRSMNSN
jgi:hypothetical protein